MRSWVRVEAVLGVYAREPTKACVRVRPRLLDLFRDPAGSALSVPSWPEAKRGCDEDRPLHHAPLFAELDDLEELPDEDGAPDYVWLALGLA